MGGIFYGILHILQIGAILFQPFERNGNDMAVGKPGADGAEEFPPQRNSRWIDLAVVVLVVIVLLGGVGNAFSNSDVLATPTATAAPDAPAVEACQEGGCVKPPDDLCSGRAIKAVVTADGQRLYYTGDHPGYLPIIGMHVERGDRWFCTAAGAEAAGFTPAPEG